MSEWSLKRFWESVGVADCDSGYRIELDGRPVHTPAKAPLIVPTRPLAEAIAEEWDAQQERVDPDVMPLSRAANAAIDKVRHQHSEVADMIAAYGDADLLCYRAESPEGLVARQCAAWDPLLEWAADHLGARLRPVNGVMHVPQDPVALGAMSGWVHDLDSFALTAMHDLVSMSGSLVIGFAAIHGQSPPEELWNASRIDETWQEELWGTDAEAAATTARKRAAFLQAHRVYALSRG